MIRRWNGEFGLERGVEQEHKGGSVGIADTFNTLQHLAAPAAPEAGK